MTHRRFLFVKQLDSQDCGIACLKMIGLVYNKNFGIKNEVIQNAEISKQGISISSLEETANEIGFNTLLVKLDFEKMVENINSPAIFFWNQNHFIVVYKIRKNKIYVADPAFGKTTYSKEEFLKGWSQNEDEGIILILEPTEKILEISHRSEKKLGLNYVLKYLNNHKTQFFLIAFTLLLSSIIELIFPFFTQKIIDKGVFFKNVNLIYLILFSQIILFISKIGLEYYRSWLFIHISNRISLSIISDFLIKLMSLPIRYFNSKNIGDITQRIQDHKRIEDFLSKNLIQIVFSFFSILIYSLILLTFNLNIFIVVVISSIIELIWIFSFLDKIKINDHKMFALHAIDQNKIYELINSIQEVKLNNLEKEKTLQWQEVQKKLYFNNIERLKIDQKYESYRFINFFQNILVIFLASLAVMNNQMTMGTMLAIMFILGGLNGPIGQVVGFVLQYQLVKVSIERLNEIHSKEEEDNISEIKEFEEIKDINISDLNFSYHKNNTVLENINLLIPKNKTTAIVGVSGSGKTTLLKLILKFYKPQSGLIKIGGHSLEKVDNILWRNKCGVILQDSVIFSDTIKYNVSLKQDADLNQLHNALKLANVYDFVESLPLKENTIIGPEGIQISQGQKQRLFIARAIYKNPDYLFFDEATNSLDSENEKIIVNNLNDYFRNKTMIVVAHRLSTVNNANQIIVLDKGKVIEVGSHNELINLRGKYYNLIKNQLELGQ